MKLAFSLITLLLLDQYTSVSPFLTPSLLPSTTSLFAKTKKKQPAAPKPARGFAPPSLTPKPVKFNVAASLARLETTYNDLTTEGFRSSISEVSGEHGGRLLRGWGEQTIDLGRQVAECAG